MLKVYNIIKGGHGEVGKTACLRKAISMISFFFMKGIEKLDAIRRLVYSGVPIDTAIKMVIKYREQCEDDELEILIQKIEKAKGDNQKCME